MAAVLGTVLLNLHIYNQTLILDTLNLLLLLLQVGTITEPHFSDMEIKIYSLPLELFIASCTHLFLYPCSLSEEILSLLMLEEFCI